MAGGKGKKAAEQQRKARLILIGILVLAALIYYIADPEGFSGLMQSVAGDAPEQSAYAQPSASPTGGAAIQKPVATAKPTQGNGSVNTAADGTLEVYFLDVGQGDCIFLRSPGGKTMLVDASESKYFEVIDDFLQAQGVEELDVVVATHPHSDHIGAMAKVIKNYSIGTFYISPETHTTSTYEKMITALEDRSVDTVALYADDMDAIDWDDAVTVRVLSPFEGYDYDMNNWSIVINVVYGETSVLLTGDAEAPAEAVMLEKLPAEYFKATILKLGHHGSSTSSSAAFWAAVSPEAVAIQVGEGNDYGHPHRETLALLKEWGGPVYRTDLNGVIHFTLDGSGYTVETEK